MTQMKFTCILNVCMAILLAVYFQERNSYVVHYIYCTCSNFHAIFSRIG